MMAKVLYRLLVAEFVIVDSVTTWYALRVMDGVREANPQMLALMDSTTIEEAVLISAAAKSLAILVLAEMAKRDYESRPLRLTKRLVVKPLMYLLAVVGLVICVNNVYLVVEGMG